MWFLAIVAGVVIVVMAGFLAGRARRAGHPALGSFTESANLPVLGASVFIAIGLARHDSAWTLAVLLLVYAAGFVTEAVAGFLAGRARRARRAGRLGLGSFAESVGWAAFGASMLVAWRLALHHGFGWTTLAGLLLGGAAYAGWLTLRRRRSNA